MPETKRAFTLLETIATIALIALLVSLTLSGLTNTEIFAGGRRSPESVLKTAVKAASNAARNTETVTELRFDSRGFFEISNTENGAVLKRVFLEPKAEKIFTAAHPKTERDAQAPTADTPAERDIAAEFKAAGLPKTRNASDPAAELRESDTEVKFALIPPEVVGKTRIEFEPQTLDPRGVRFAPDGTCAEFEASITFKNSPETIRLRSDPMTSSLYEKK